ncbi:hypothetical protein ACROYT_G003098 [Oculina patagonica]
MNAKVLLVFALILLVGSFVTKSDAFTAGGGGNLPGKREMEHQVAGRELCRAAREHCKREFVLNDIE